MDYELSEEHKLIRDTARRIAREKVAPRAAEIDVTEEYPEDTFQVYKEAGLLGLAIPAAYNGAGAGTLGLALAVEEVSKYCNASGLMLLLSSLSTQPIVIGGTEDQKHEIVGRVATGEIKGAFCLTEPSAGSDAANIRTRAVRDGDDYIINGEKSYISGGTVADYVVCFARTAQNGAGAISSFIVDSKSPGFSVARSDRKMGVRGLPTAHIVFDNVRVPPDRLIGHVEGKGFKSAMLGLNSLRPVVGSRGLGLAEGCLAYALDFARKRETFGSPLTDRQAIQFMFADMAIQIEAARHLVYHAAWMVDQGKYTREYAHHLSMAKAYATEMANKVASDALQILGAQGYMMDHPIERQYRDARQLMIVEGTSQVQRMVIARSLIEEDLVYN
ncbi:MAG: acyl-CoA dehydrogenase [Dehalococcoidia bacterium]|nr:acyl-CoA dehydrogenase [Dehalococcoidia bacterium]